MATGQGQGGGLFGRPDVETLGIGTWAQMAGVHPDNPLVGGHGAAGNIDPDYHYHRVALAASPTGNQAPVPSHWSELLNLKASPMPWLLLAAIAYLGLVHLHVTGRVGRGK